MSKPKISLLCPSYNHERFVGFFIDSVLKQTVQDWELMIVDDCSTDNNVKEIEKYKDPRIKLLKHDYNQGINAGLNDAFELAQGEYCVFIASDDMLMPNHLESSIGYLEVHPEIDVFYCSLLPINDNNEDIQDEAVLYARKNNKSRYELLERIFVGKNDLSSPGMAVRYGALRCIMPLPLGMLQHQDTKMHVELLMNGEVYQSMEKLVQYRRIAGGKNVSSNTILVRQRTYLEEAYLLDSFLQIKSVDVLHAIFKDRLALLGASTGESIPYFLGRLALMTECAAKKAWGYNVVMHFLDTKEHQRLLYDLYGFNFKCYLNLASSPESCEWKVYEQLLQREEKQFSRVKKYRKAVKILLALILLLGIAFVMQLCMPC